MPSLTAQPIAVDQASGQFVPQKEILGNQPKPKQHHDFSEFLREHCAAIRRKDKGGYMKRHKKWLTNWFFYDGRQYGFWDDEEGAYYDSQPNRRNNFYINNHLSWFVDATQKEWARAKTELLGTPTDDSPESAGAARIGTNILGYYQRTLRGPVEHQGEGLTAAMCSNYFRYTYFSLLAGNRQAKIPQMGSQTIKLTGDTYQCMDCGMPGAANDLVNLASQNPAQQPQMGQMSPAGPGAGMSGSSSAGPGQSQPIEGTGLPPTQPTSPATLGAATSQGTPLPSGTCPDCGSNNVQMQPGVSIDMNSVESYQEGPLGDIVSENVDPFEIKVHPKARGGQIKTSPYIFRQRTILRSVLEEAYPWVDIPSGDTDTDNPSIRYMRNLERSAGSLTDRARWGEDVQRSREGDDDDMVIFTQMWLDRNMYSSYQFPATTTLGSPQSPITIPANTPLSEVFPDGLYVAIAGDHILDVRNENKNDHWVGGVYKLMPTSFWGRGIEDSVWQQRLLNDTYNLLVAYLKHCSAPTVLYNPLFIDGEELSGAPGEVIPVENAGTDAQLSAYYMQVAPSQMPGQIPAFIESCKKDMQAQIGAFSPVSGAPDIDISTATGIKLLREASVALIAMALSIKAQVDTEWGQQILKLCQKNWVLAHAIPIDKQYSQVEVKWYSSTDIAKDIQVTYADHSVTPRSEIERRNDILEAMAAGGVPLGIWNPQLPPELRRLLAERFNIPYNADAYSQSERIAKIRLDNILQLCKVAPQIGAQVGPAFTMPDPTTGQVPAIQWVLQQVPVDMLMDDHDTQMGFLKDWSRTDDGINSSEFIKEVIRARYKEQFMAKVQQRQMEMQGEIMAQAPAMQAQAAMAAGQQAGQGPPSPPQGVSGGPVEKPPATKAPKPTKDVGPSAMDYV